LPEVGGGEHRIEHLSLFLVLFAQRRKKALSEGYTSALNHVGRFFKDILVL
jgi:hypothetical protein